MVRVVFPLFKKKKKKKKEKKKIVIFDFFYTKSIISKYIPVSTKLGKNIYVQQNLNECDHGSNWSYLLLNWEKLLHSTLFTL